MRTINIKCINLCKSYTDKVVLSDLNFEIKDSELWEIIGESGIGKTTLFNILMGLVRHDSGTISGLDNTTISSVFQEDRLINSISAVKNIEIVSDMSKSEIERHLSLVLPKDCIYKKTSQLSGGMKRRVCIVRAIVSKSELVLMDEPFKGLDDECRRSVVSYILENLNGRALCVISHDELDAKLLGITNTLKIT